MVMKHLLIIVLSVFFLASCSQFATRSEYFQHDTLYKNWDHTKFSWFGHSNPTPEDLEKSKQQQWWGYDVPYVPGQ